jgi:hypothetical protein
VEPDYLSDLEVFVFSRVYIPCRLYTPPHEGEGLQGGLSPLVGYAGIIPPTGGGQGFGDESLEGKIAL